ncbi:PREDICTED: mast cell carboxypeptidase A-like, partial [Galeopterus variegatus]|uniref:Mast cell carboxypeptidase A-like n=1 Tax=Galeopterus variegatus TaxID=482537 RepID=A0ABM0RFX1_GALVR
MRFILPVGLIAATLAMAPVRFDREKVFRVKPQDEKQANIIKDLAKTSELDFWYPDSIHHVAANMTVDFQVGEKESQSVQSALDLNKMHYEILIHDLQEEIEKQFDVKEDMPSRHSYAKYNNWDKIVAWTEKMVNKHPEMVSRIKIGSTVEDNPLYILKNRMWRKNHSKNQNSKCIGTDLNRNFNISWN